MLATFEDFRSAARRRLPRLLFDYIDGGAYAENSDIAGFAAALGAPPARRGPAFALASSS